MASKVLLVEDDNNLREIYEARLQAEGYTIVTAKDGEEALVVAKAEKPDLIISDVMMPRISGFEMLDILRNTEELRYTKVIMLTALGQADDKVRANSLGADRYLVKSQVTLEDIVKAAHELIENQNNPPSNGGSATPPPVPGAPPPDSQNLTQPTSPPPVAAMVMTPSAGPPTMHPNAAVPVPAFTTVPNAFTSTPPSVVNMVPSVNSTAQPPIPAVRPTPEPVMPATFVATPAPTLAPPSVGSTPPTAVPAPSYVMARTTPPVVDPMRSSTAPAPPAAMVTTAPPSPVPEPVVPVTITSTPPSTPPPAPNDNPSHPTGLTSNVIQQPEPPEPVNNTSSAPSEPTTPKPTAILVLDASAPETSTAAEEKAIVTNQIEDFVHQADEGMGTPVGGQPQLPKTPSPSAASDHAQDDSVLADAMSDLTGQPASMASQAVNNVTMPPFAPVVPTEQVPRKIKVDDSPSNNSVTIANKKVIQPLKPIQKPNLDELLAREEAKKITQAGYDPHSIVASDSISSSPDEQQDLPSLQPLPDLAPPASTNPEGMAVSQSQIDPNNIAL